MIFGMSKNVAFKQNLNVKCLKETVENDFDVKRVTNKFTFAKEGVLFIADQYKVGLDIPFATTAAVVLVC